jgi:hypothetical protein
MCDLHHVDGVSDADRKAGRRLALGSAGGLSVITRRCVAHLFAHIQEEFAHGNV